MLTTPIRYNVNDEGESSLQHYSWIPSHLANITHYEMSIPLEPALFAPSIQDGRFLVCNMPKLRSLHLLHWVMYVTSENLDSYVDLDLLVPVGEETVRFPNLESLRLHFFDLAKGSRRLLSGVDASNLQSITLDMCRNIIPFLAEFTGPGCLSSTVLRHVRIKLEWNVDQVAQTLGAINTFLQNRTGIERFILDVNRHGLLDKQSICAHADTLYVLILSTGQSDRAQCYSTQDLGHILCRCHKLQSIAVNMPLPQLGLLLGLATRFRLGPDVADGYHVETEFESTLVRPSENAIQFRLLTA
jgi:hypothetical protein